MKVILRQDVPSLGRKGAVVELSEGYGRNYLLPRGLAVEATPANLKALEQQEKAAQQREARAEAEARALAAELASRQVVIPVRVGEGGKLFGAVTAKDIAEAISAAGGPTIDRRKFELPEPLRTLGSFQVPVRLHPQVSLTLTVVLVEQESGREKR
ncbi:MAG: 50S ribosomal protein L9 [Bacillota bacterium]|nr:50S ribosomal protein L9 [Bacillota bacterium]